MELPGLDIVALDYGQPLVLGRGWYSQYQAAAQTSPIAPVTRNAARQLN